MYLWCDGAITSEAISFLYWTVCAMLLALSLGIVVVSITPLLQPLLDYGKVNLADKNQAESWPLLMRTSLNWMYSLKVRKSYFWHFYALSTLYCIAEYFAYFQNAPLSTRALIIMMFFQSTRRLLECFLEPKSSSSMHVFHYAVGIFFYSSIALCIVESRYHNSPHDIMIIFAVFQFILASLLQARAHYELRHTKKYEFPKSPLFQSNQIACPHYSAEIAIYRSFCLVCPKSVGLALASLWVMVSLGISARRTLRYYKKTGYSIKYAIFLGIL